MQGKTGNLERALKTVGPIPAYRGGPSKSYTLEIMVTGGNIFFPHDTPSIYHFYICFNNYVNKYIYI